MKSPEEDQPKIKKGAAAYIQYTGLAFQMAGIIIICIFVGQKLDDYFELPKSYFTGLLTFFGLIGFMYKLYRELMKK